MKTLKIYMAVVLCSTMFFACNRAMVGERNVVDNAEPADAKFASKTEPMGTYQVTEFNDWDPDNSGGISSREFTAGIMNDNLFFDWDTDNSGYLNSTEFNLGVYGQWDHDGNKEIDNDEWSMRSTVWDNPTIENAQINALAPAIGRPIICRKLDDGYVKCSNYMPWDMDLNGLLDINEFNDGTFRSLDRNGNGIVDSNEFNAYTGSTSMNTSPRSAAR